MHLLDHALNSGDGSGRDRDRAATPGGGASGCTAWAPTARLRADRARAANSPEPVRFVFPHAPMRPVTINQGMRMRAWYDILQFGGGPRGRGRHPGFAEARWKQLIARESRGKKRSCWPDSRRAARSCCRPRLRHPERLAGVLGAFHLSAARLDAGAGAQGPAKHDVPIFMAHGQFDDIIPIRRAEHPRMLEPAGLQVEWHEYPMPHSVCAAEIGDISRFLTRVLAGH